MKINFVNKVDISDDESHLNLSQQSFDREYFKLREYVPLKLDQSQDIKSAIFTSENTNDKVKDFHSLMIHKDINFFSQYIDDLYVIGIDLFNLIEMIRQYEDAQKKELHENSEKLRKMEDQLKETTNQKKYNNINIQEVELDAMFEDMYDLENERISLSEGFEPMLLGSISIPDIDDTLNLVFLWCTIALYGNYKEDYFWENFKTQVFRKNAIEDFVQRLLYKKASKMTRDQSFIAAEILSKQDEFLAKPYLKKKQKVQLEKLFQFIKNINECWIISQEIRIKVLYFEQVQKEFQELEGMKKEHEVEKKTFEDRQNQFELTMSSLNETRAFLENQLTEMVESQQNSEQYLLYLNEASRKYFQYYDKSTIYQREKMIEDVAYGRQAYQSVSSVFQQSIQNLQTNQVLRDSHILLMNQPDIQSQDGQTIPTIKSDNNLIQKVKAFEMVNQQSPFKQNGDTISIGQGDAQDGEIVQKLNQFQYFDAEKELDKSSEESDQEDKEEHENFENINEKGSEKEDACNIF
ncbi:hypothetical protein ABPG72_008709 [Tetrahymena utriculariae]